MHFYFFHICSLFVDWHPLQLYNNIMLKYVHFYNSENNLQHRYLWRFLISVSKIFLWMHIFFNNYNIRANDNIWIVFYDQLLKDWFYKDQKTKDHLIKKIANSASIQCLKFSTFFAWTVVWFFQPLS